jgi:hypothetical protein
MAPRGMTSSPYFRGNSGQVRGASCGNQRLHGPINGMSAKRLGENLIYLLPNLLTPGRLQVPHRRFHGRMAEPLLHSAQIDTRPKAPRCERRTKLVQPEVVLVELRTLDDALQAVEEVELRIAPSGGEHQIAGLACFRLPRLQTLNQLCRDGNLALFVRLRCPPPVWLVADAHGRMGEVDV